MFWDHVRATIHATPTNDRLELGKPAAATVIAFDKLAGEMQVHVT